VNADEGWRQLTAEERAILDLLLSRPCNGGEFALATLDNCLVRPWVDHGNHCPSLEFKVEAQSTRSRQLSTGASGVNHADGMPYYVTVFGDDGDNLLALEFTLHGDAPLLHLPDVTELQLQ
jgi:hypothetical protein